MKCRLCRHKIKETEPHIVEPNDKGDHKYVHMTCYTAEKARRLIAQAQKKPP